ncbi:MAG: heavy-metal-associated domain-containing protein [Phycisphaerae bacterium]
MQRFEVAIDGMHCGGCVNRVTTALKGLPGVTLEAVNIGSASGRFDEQATNVNAIVQSLGKLGFDARATQGPASPGGCCGGSCHSS